MFSKRKSKPKGPGETEIFLNKNPDPNIKDLLNKEDISVQFREKNSILIGYFLGKDSNDRLNMEKIFEYIMTTKERADQKQLFSLYQMSNVCLHRVFADSVNIAKIALETVGRTEPEKQFAMGVFSRILSRAIDQWPEEIWQVFWNTEGAVAKIIMNLDSSCIYQSILDCFVQKHHPHISALMWYIFLSLIPEKKAREYTKDPPSFCLFIPIVDDFENYDTNIAKCHQSLGNAHIFNIISLFIEYFKNSLDKIEEFHEKFFDYVSSANENDINDDKQFYPRLFEIAKIIGPNEKVMNKSLEIINQTDNFEEPKVQYCGQYLSICSTLMDEQTTEKVIKTLLNEKSKQFTITAVLKLVSYVIEDGPEWLNSFRDNMREYVVKFWKDHSQDHLNKNTNQANFMLLDAVLTIARIIYNSELNDEIGIKILANKAQKKEKNDGEEEEEEGRSFSYSSSNNNKPSPNDTVDKDFFDSVGKKWGDLYQQVCNWSNPNFMSINIKKGSKKIDTPVDELQKSIVIRFNEESYTDNQSEQDDEEGDD